MRRDGMYARMMHCVGSTRSHGKPINGHKDLADSPQNEHWEFQVSHGIKDDNLYTGYNARIYLCLCIILLPIIAECIMHFY